MIQRRKAATRSFICSFAYCGFLAHCFECCDPVESGFQGRVGRSVALLKLGCKGCVDRSRPLLKYSEPVLELTELVFDLKLPVRDTIAVGSHLRILSEDEGDGRR